MSEADTSKNAAEAAQNPTRRGALFGAAAATAAVGAAAGAAAASTTQTSRDVEGQCVFVTGGARGIGLACGEEMARGGANVVLFDIAEQPEHVRYPLASEADLDAARAQIEAHGVQCITVKGDVRDRQALDRAVALTQQRFGRLDMLVVNAGVTHVGALEAFSDAEIQTVIDINFTGAVKTIQAATPMMRQQGSGSISVIASMLGRMGNELFPVYAATKWATIGLAKSTALIMAPHNVTCNAICPTWVRTVLMNNDYVLQAVSPDNPTVEAVEAFAAAMNPLPMAAYDPEDIGRLVKFFGSPAAAQITGEVFDVSAGAGARGAV